MAKPYAYDDNIYVGGPKLPNWRLRLLIRDHSAKANQTFMSWKESVLLTVMTISLLVTASLSPYLACILLAGIFIGGVVVLFFIDQETPSWVVALIIGGLFITPLGILILILVLALLCTGTIMAWWSLLDSWRVARKKTDIRYWSHDPALILLAHRFEDKGGDKQWLRQEASKHGDVTNMIDAYIEASSPLVAEFPSDWKSRPIDKAMLERGRSSLEHVTRAANELAGCIMLTYGERLEAANKAVAEQRAYKKASQDFLAAQEAKLKQQSLQMAKDDLNNFIEGLSFQRHQGSHHS